MKSLLAAAAIALIAFIPAQAGAQNYEELIAKQYQDSQNPRGNKKASAEESANSIYGDIPADGGTGETSFGDNDQTGEEETMSYDQMAIGTDGPQDIYSYIAGQENKGDPAAKRSKSAARAHEEALRQRAAVIKKMQKNSTDQIRKQKERAWKLSHPGEEYPGEENEEEGDDTASNDGGDSDGEEGGDAGMSDAAYGQDDNGGGGDDGSEKGAQGESGGY